MRQNPFPRCLSAPSIPTPFATALATSVVHTLDIECSVAKLRDFMGDAQHWLPWALPALQSVQPLPFGQWLLKTSRQFLKLRRCPTHPTAQHELHYELVVPTLGSCQVLLHSVATPTGCRLAVTLCQHQQLPLPLDAFTASARHALSGLQTLKLVLEQD